MEENQSLESDDLNKPEEPEKETDSKTSKPGSKKGLGGKLRGLVSHLNIYLLLFVLIVVLVGGFTFVSYERNKKEATPTTIQSQTLTQDALNKLNGSDATVGDAKQTLTVASNAIFNGKVLVRDSVDIAGTIKVGGSVTLSGLTVSGTSLFDQIQGNKLSVSGDTNIQGQLTVQKTLTASSGASFGGPITAPQITVQSFQLSGDFQLQRHIDAGGTTPGKTDGGALGAGGTVSVSGTDTAGTITINTGGGPAAGCFVTVNFTNKFNATPHIVVTPVGSAAAGLNYYVTRTTGSFTLCTTNPAPGGVNFAFDWVAID